MIAHHGLARFAAYSGQGESSTNGKLRKYLRTDRLICAVARAGGARAAMLKETFWILRAMLPRARNVEACHAAYVVICRNASFAKKRIWMLK